MLFNSWKFLVFFPVVTTLYFLTPHRFRWFLLLIASAAFYMAFIPPYILILVFTITIDYCAGLLIENAQGQLRRVFLTISILSNCGVLFIFKYFNFFNGSLAHVAQLIHWNYPIKDLAIILPIGLSFHTFQAISYTIEVYRGKQKAERHFGIFALYVMFYPQLVAGPIERPQNLMHQFYEEHRFSYEQVTNGLKLMAWGFFKKVVIADRLAMVVNQVYSNPESFPGPVLALATFFFAYQVYCDFSGYSDIAIGSAQVMGFKLCTNFLRPYQARSLSELWSRWHISLTSWFRDYVYTPLWLNALRKAQTRGSNRVSRLRMYLNIFLVLLITGFWHGANWTFLAFGALHGVFLVAWNILEPYFRPFKKLNQLWYLRIISSLFPVVLSFGLWTFALVLFRARSLADAWMIYSHLFTGYGVLFDSSARGLLFLSLALDSTHLMYCILSILLLTVVEWLQKEYGSIRQLLNRKPMWVRWGSYYAIVSIILLLGVFNNSKFIYFQF